MKLAKLHVENFRTLEDVVLEFPSYYTALSGKNDCGKTNVLRAIRTLLPPPRRYYYAPSREDVNLKEDFPKWKGEPKGLPINISATLSVSADQDEGLHHFITDYLKLGPGSSQLEVELRASFSDSPKRSLQLTVDGQSFGERQAEEVLSKCRSSSSFLMYNSTSPFDELGLPGGFENYLGDFTGGDAGQLEALKGTVNRGLKRIALRHQKDMADLLGRLKDRFRVGLSVPSFGFEYMPLSITLGDKAVEVDLDEWGSGTRNRTLILLTLFRARRISEAPGSAAKTTPIIVIEEPESFLHPSAQAEFGKILQELAEEFQVQVIVSTHSPYMLSQDRPEANILLERAVVSRQIRGTKRVDTSGGNWMTPFGQALGLDNAEFIPWRDVFFGARPALLLVEGDIDKEYFELLRDNAHGDKRLDFDGDIFPYGGWSQLQNTTMLKFIRGRFKRSFITYDLDCDAEASRTLASLGLQRHKDFIAIGRDGDLGAIEGLVPDTINQKVYAQNSALVTQLMHGNKERQKSARNRLKRLILEAFKKEAKPGTADFAQFYKVVREINRALG
jgi:energy-coupling factor transporter ATP-binding protein EcfA2